MCAQLHLEVVGKRPKNKVIPSNFHEFWSEEVHCKNYPKKTLMIECYNLVDPMIDGLLFFGVDVQQGNSKIL
jgi:hypothetical protein